jgi:hypothetical protein
MIILLSKGEKIDTYPDAESARKMPDRKAEKFTVIPGS